MSDLTAERLRERLNYNPLTGVFTWRTVTSTRVKVGDVAGEFGHKSGYGRISIDGKKYLMHRLAWMHVHGVWPSSDLDHEDCNKANNRIKNLRVASKRLNQENRRTCQVNSRSGYLGVSVNTNGAFSARIKASGVRIYLGTFNTPEAAHAAYLAAKRTHHEGNTL